MVSDIATRPFLSYPQHAELSLQAVLSDLGMLDGKGAGEASLFTANHMRVADAQAVQQGLGLSLEAFCKFYDTLVMNRARQQLRFRLGLQAEGEPWGAASRAAVQQESENIDLRDLSG